MGAWGRSRDEEVEPAGSSDGRILERQRERGLWDDGVLFPVHLIEV